MKDTDNLPLVPTKGFITDDRDPDLTWFGFFCVDKAQERIFLVADGWSSRQIAIDHAKAVWSAFDVSFTPLLPGPSEMTALVGARERYEQEREGADEYIDLLTQALSDAGVHFGQMPLYTLKSVQMRKMTDETVTWKPTHERKRDGVKARLMHLRKLGGAYFISESGETICDQVDNWDRLDRGDMDEIVGRSAHLSQYEDVVAETEPWRPTHRHVASGRRVKWIRPLADENNEPRAEYQWKNGTYFSAFTRYYEQLVEWKPTHFNLLKPVEEVEYIAPTVGGDSLVHAQVRNKYGDIYDVDMSTYQRIDPTSVGELMYQEGLREQAEIDKAKPLQELETFQQAQELIRGKFAHPEYLSALASMIDFAEDGERGDEALPALERFNAETNAEIPENYEYTKFEDIKAGAKIVRVRYNSGRAVQHAVTHSLMLDNMLTRGATKNEPGDVWFVKRESMVPETPTFGVLTFQSGRKTHGYYVGLPNGNVLWVDPENGAVWSEIKAHRVVAFESLQAVPQKDWNLFKAVVSSHLPGHLPGDDASDREVASAARSFIEKVES